MTEKDKKDEKKVTAASYILQFYTEIQLLNDYYAQYVNLLLELENKYKDTEKATDEEKAVLINATQQVRHTAIKTFIEYKSLVFALKKEENDDIKTSIDLIKKDFIIKRDVLEDYVIKLNAVLVDEVIKKLLETTEDILNSLYNDD